MTPLEIKPLTSQEIEDLRPGPKTDAAIEREFFEFVVYGTLGGHYLIDEKPDDPDANTRSPRMFSRRIEAALKILDACPGWRAWHDVDGINVHITKIIDDGATWVNSIGRDQTLIMAICKAALNLVLMERDWRESHEEKKNAPANS